MDYAHEVNRDRMLTRHVDGRRCWWCARPMYRDKTKNWDGKSLHAEHTRTRKFHGVKGNRADRLMHDTCNKQRGDGSRDDQRPALATLTDNPDYTTPLGGPLAMGWPQWQ
jgi:hypothetical protein